MAYSIHLILERRAEQLFHSQSDAGHMFESYRPQNGYSTSASLQNLHYSPHRQQRSSPPKPPLAYNSHLPQSQSFSSELDTILQSSTAARLVHRENDIDRSSFHQPAARRTTRLTPSKCYRTVFHRKLTFSIYRRDIFIIEWTNNSTEKCKCIK